MLKKTFTIEILYEADKEYEMGNEIKEAVENLMDYSDVIQGYEVNISLEDNQW